MQKVVICHCFPPLHSNSLMSLITALRDTHTNTHTYTYISPKHWEIIALLFSHVSRHLVNQSHKTAHQRQTYGHIEYTCIQTGRHLGPCATISNQCRVPDGAQGEVMSVLRYSSVQYQALSSRCSDASLRSPPLNAVVISCLLCLSCCIISRQLHNRPRVLLQHAYILACIHSSHHSARLAQNKQSQSGPPGDKYLFDVHCG